MNVTLELYGFQTQTTQVKLIRVQDGMAIVEGYTCPEESYRLSDGRRMENGKPTNWDFWRLSESDRRCLARDLKLCTNI